jgi:hypothetical protein
MLTRRPAVIPIVSHVRQASPAARTALAVGIIVAVVLAAFTRTLFLGRALYVDDIGVQDYPWQVYLAHARAAGAWLPWVAEIGGGFPRWANGQSGAFSPVNLLFLLPLSPTWVFGLAMMLQYLLAATGMFPLSRLLGLSRLAAVTAGVVFALTGFMAAHQVHYGMLSAAAWLPWVTYSVILWSRRLNPWAFVLASVGAAMAASNYPQMLVLTLAFALACVAACPGPQPVATSLGKARWRLAIALLPFAAGVLLAGVQLVPLMDIIDAGCGAVSRGGGYGFMSSGSLSPAQLVMLFLPDWFGTAHGGDWHGPVNHWELCGYMGSAALALVAISRPGRPGLRRLYACLVVVAVVALLLALGHYIPTYRLLYLVPIYNRFRIPARWILAWSAAFSLLCAVALHGTPESLRPRLRTWRIVTALGALALIAFGAELLGRLHLSAPLGSNLIEFGLTLAALAVGISLFALRRIGPTALRWFIFAVIAAQSVVFIWRYNPTVAPGYYDPSPLVAELQRQQSPLGRVICSGYGPDYPVPGCPNPGPIQPNENLLWGLSTLEIYDPLGSPVSGVTKALGTARLLDPDNAAALGVDLLVTPGSQPAPGGWTLRARVGGNAIYHNDRYRGIAWTELTAGPSRTVAASRLANGHYRFEIASGEAQSLIVAVADLPDWQARVDGQAVDIRPAHSVFMDVAIPTEPCVVDLEYRPAGISDGLSVTLAGALLVIVVCAGATRYCTRASVRLSEAAKGANAEVRNSDS